MAELKRLFASLENAELAYRAQIDEEHSSILNQLHALSAHSHVVKHKYLTTMKDTFAGLFSLSAEPGVERIVLFCS